MMVLGFAGIGFLAYRRKNGTAVPHHLMYDIKGLN
jgi:hypothetical protein